MPPVSSKSVTTPSERPAGVDHLAADQVRLIDFVLGERGALFERDGNFGAGQLLGVRNRVDALELEDQMIAMHPGVLHFHGCLVDEDALQAIGLAGERESGQLPFVSARAKQTGDGDELQILIPEFPA